jgi:hypothetical protein
MWGFMTFKTKAIITLELGLLVGIIPPFLFAAKGVSLLPRIIISVGVYLGLSYYVINGILKKD